MLPCAPAAHRQALEGPLEKKAGVNYGPPGSKSLVYFVDDLNMPKLDPYETAMPISLIRQHLGWGHWCGAHAGPFAQCFSALWLQAAASAQVHESRGQ